MYSLAPCMFYGFNRLASPAGLGRRAEASDDLATHRGRSLAVLDTGYVSSPKMKGVDLYSDYMSRFASMLHIDAATQDLSFLTIAALP